MAYPKNPFASEQSPNPVTLSLCIQFYSLGGTYADVPGCPSTVTDAPAMVDWSSLLDLLEQNAAAASMWQWINQGN
jgi:hypothetical protein